MVRNTIELRLDSDNPEAGMAEVHAAAGKLLEQLPRVPAPPGSPATRPEGQALVQRVNETRQRLASASQPDVGNLDEATGAFFLVWSGANLVRWTRVRREQRKAREHAMNKEEQ